MVRLLLGLTVLSSLVSCSGTSENKSSIYFGGEIVNPTSDYVVLYHNDAYVDSVKLDNNNHFAFRFDNIEEGLYHFDHAPELQYVYLSKGDSLLARLNTVEFDESLVYSGKGSEINNFLIEVFLKNEKEEDIVKDFYVMDPETFSKKIDSLHTAKMNHLKDLALENEFSDRAYAMAEASIDYNTYITKEKYPFYHKKRTGEETIHELDDSFYEYRKKIDLNNKDLTYFRPYFDFMKWHFGNMSYTACLEDCTSDNKEPVVDRLHFNKHKLALVDSLVHQVELRDILFRNVAMDYLLREHKTSEEASAFIEKFKKLSSNDQHKEEIDLLYKGIKNLQPNTALPNLLVKNMNNEEVSIKELANNKKNTVFYFWTAEQKRHFRNVNQHITSLEEKYPHYNFIGINLRTNYNQWQQLMEEYQLDTNKQYFGENFKELQMAMIIDGLNKCVIAKDTVIVDGFANLYTSL
ncbi:TlpA family protein disulfide reductase [Flagellimonas marinaquae]|uniref:TlpA family protein disulfide reductase n=1 Tax=Flagellimonas marinaquae TaxID=254955 RepID=UPI002074E7AA|nr:transaldolase [Allomuricauda aquimarina]USD25248.1 transaldolase [Allomuricauda aquimarina]